MRDLDKMDRLEDAIKDLQRAASHVHAVLVSRSDDSLVTFSCDKLLSDIVISQIKVREIISVIDKKRS